MAGEFQAMINAALPRLAAGYGNTGRGRLLCCLPELRKSQYRSGPLYQLRDTIDKSQLLADGRLIRSKRLARLEAALVISRGAVPGRKLAQLAGLVDAMRLLS